MRKRKISFNINSLLGHSIKSARCDLPLSGLKKKIEREEVKRFDSKILEI
jgi:hypothetical protein